MRFLPILTILLIAASPSFAVDPYQVQIGAVIAPASRVIVIDADNSTDFAHGGSVSRVDITGLILGATVPSTANDYTGVTLNFGFVGTGITGPSGLAVTIPSASAGIDGRSNSYWAQVAVMHSAEINQITAATKYLDLSANPLKGSTSTVRQFNLQDNVASSMATEELASVTASTADSLVATGAISPVSEGDWIMWLGNAVGGQDNLIIDVDIFYKTDANPSDSAGITVTDNS